MINLIFYFLTSHRKYTKSISEIPTLTYLHHDALGLLFLNGKDALNNVTMVAAKHIGESGVMPDRG